jgi:hypothetical protein
MPGLACSLLIAALSSAVVEAAAGADAEIAAGRAPIDVDSPEESSLTFTLVPGAALRLRSRTTSLTLSYAPRIFYRLPNALGIDRPLVLHQIGLDHREELSRQVAWASSAKLSIGEVDYTAGGLVFGTGTTSVPTSVADVFRLEAQTGLKFELSRRVNLSWELSGEYTTSLGDSVAATPVVVMPTDPGAPAQSVVNTPLPESAQLTSEWSLSYALSHTDRVGPAAEITYQWFPDTGRYLLLSPNLFWDRQLSRRTDIGLSAGVAYVITLETAQLGGDTSDNLGGTGSFQLGSVLYKSRRVSWTTRLNASLDWFFDPLAGTSQPRAGGQLSNDIAVGRDWLISPNVSFYSLLREASTRVGAGADTPNPVPEVIRPDATMFRAELPFRYAVSRSVTLNFGGRAAMRGRALSQPGYRVNEQQELWAFVGLTVRLASGHDYGSWLAL